MVYHELCAYKLINTMSSIHIDTYIIEFNRYLMRIITCFFMVAVLLVSSHVYAEASVLRVANSKAWKPFSYLDEQNQPSGILIDFWREYGERNNVKIEFVLLDWNDSLHAVKEGKADVHAGLMWSESRDKFLDYGEALFSIETQLYCSQDALKNDIDLMLDGNFKGRLGVVNGGYEEQFARREFPYASLQLYENNQWLIERAFAGEIDAFIADLHVANFYLYSSGQPLTFVPVKFLYSGDIFPAVAEGNQILIDSIDNGFDKLNTHERNNILNRWIHIETVYPKYLLPLSIVLTASLVFTYIVVLRKTVKARTHQLEMANAKLAELALTDELTQMHNRRYFMERLDSIKAADRPIAVMVFDIDDFKVINDTWGHMVGDEVIRDVANAAKKVINPDIVFARVGGEEFAVLAFNLEFSEAHQQAEAICSAVNSIKFDNNSITNVSVSLGCAYYQSENSTLDTNLADRLMYKAKSLGKNRVVSEIVD